MKTLRTIILLVLLGAVSPRLLQAQTIETYTFTTNRVVPDGNAAGLSDVRNVNSAIGNITSLKVRLKLTGEYNGDLYGYVRHASGFTVLLNRPGKTAANAAGYGDSGFDVTFQTGAANGDVHGYQNVTLPAAGAPLTGAWEPDGRTADPTNVTDVSVRATSLTNFNGLNAAGEWTLYLADVESGGTNLLAEWALEITGAAYPTLTWTNPADIVYGTALGGSQLNATATYNATNVPGIFAYTPAAGTVLNAGLGQTLAVTFTPTDPTSFLSITTNVTLNVTPAALTIAANVRSKVYGAVDPALTYTVSGLQTGDTEAAVLTGSLSRAAGEAVGGYAITQNTLAANANYAISFTGNTLTITPATLAIAANVRSKVYGAVDPALTYAVSGLQFSDTEAAVLTGSLSRAAGEAVGGYAITQNTLAANANYAISFTGNTLTITPATITVTADNKSKAYGAALPELTANYTGFVLSQGTNDLTGLATITTTATATSDVGTYSITASGAASPNYLFAYVAGTLTVTQSVTAGVLASSANPALPGADVTFTATLSAVAPGAGAPVGAVIFRIDGSIAGSGTLSGGAASFTINNLAHGSHTVIAEYAGNLNFVGTTNSLAPDQVINTPPVAGGDNLERYPTQGVKVLLATLLANDSDADGDALNISVSSTSANGGTLAVSSGWVFYTPAAGFANADSFTYTITDGHGASVIGTVTVAIKADNDPGQNLTITDLGNGSIRVNGDGIPGRTYRLQSTGTLSPANWQDISGGSVTADSTGRFQYTDTPGAGPRYYRSVYP